MGRRAAARCSACRAAMLPEVRDCAAEFGATAPELFGARHPDPRHRRRSAGGDCSARRASRRAWSKATYGTGCFVLLNTGATAVRVAEPAAHDDRLAARRQEHLRAGGLDLRRRRGGAVAARRPQGDCDRRARPGRWRRRPTTARRHPGAGFRRPRRAALGRAGARRDLWPDARHGPARIGARRARKRVPTRPAICSTRCGETGAALRTASCASMAA